MNPDLRVGDVVIHHFRPKVWVVTVVTSHGEDSGPATTTDSSRDDALTTARRLLKGGHRLYIRHHDDAQWEEVATL